jgi:3-oxoadipate enol-lactonase
VSAVALHHDVSGPEGAPVLVLGGSLGTRLTMWDPLLPLLTDRLRVVRIDWRGHGSSPVPPGPYAMSDLGQDVVALLDRLGLERVHYGGLSIGGMVGTWLGANAPERFDTLTLMCSTLHVNGGSFAERAETVRQAGSVEPLADTVVGRWLTPDYAASHRQMRDWLRAMLADSPPEGYAGCCEAIGAMDLRADAGRITARTLVISGAQDPSIPPEHQRAQAAAIPGARLAVVDPAAHLVAVERPDAVARLVLEHVLGAA